MTIEYAESQNHSIFNNLVHKAIPERVNNVYPVLYIQKKDISSFAFFQTAYPLMQIQGICGIEGRCSQSLFGCQSVIGAGIMSSQAHIIWKCIGTKIASQSSDHIMFPH